MKLTAPLTPWPSAPAQPPGRRLWSAGRAALLLLALVSALSAGPAWSAKTQAKPPPLIEDALEKAGSDRRAAVGLLEEYLTGEADEKVRPWAMLYAGEQRRLAGDRSVARSWFEQLAAAYPSGPLKEAALLGMAVVDADKKDPSGKGLVRLQATSAKHVPDTLNADRYRILARVAAADKASAAEVRALAEKSVQYAAADPEVLARVQGEVGDIVANGASGAPPPASASRGGTEEEQAVERIRDLLEADRFDEAAASAKELLANGPEGRVKRMAEGLQKRAAAKDPAVAGRVGVLLPEAGDYASIAARLKADMELANQRSGAKLELVFLNTGDVGGDPVPAVEQLVLQKGCVALIGPLLKEHLRPVAEAADSLGVPIITLNQGQDPASVGDFAFRGFLPVEQQVGALLDHVMGQRSMRRFAVMHPNNAYGLASRDAFVAEVTKRGGEVPRTVGYDPASRSFLPAARELSARDQKAGSAELARLRAAAKAKGQDPSKVVLPPSIAFDAIFIPDSGQRAALIASALAFQEFPVGKFRPQWGMDPVLLMGLNGWNSPDTARAGGDYMQGGVLVDAFWSGSNKADIRAFVETYKSHFNRRPDVLDAITWDVTRIASAAVSAGGTNRAKIREELLKTRIDHPVGGGAGFGELRDVERKLMVLTIRGDELRPWTADGGDSAPEQPADP